MAINQNIGPLLTLEYRYERLTKLVRQQRIRQLPKVLLDHISHVVCLSAIEVKTRLRCFSGIHVLYSERAGGTAGGFNDCPELGNAGFHASFAKYSHLEKEKPILYFADLFVSLDFYWSLH